MVVRKGGLAGSLTWMTESHLRVRGLVCGFFSQRIRCSQSVVTQELVTGDVMRSDYRLVRKLAAKGWPVIPQSLKECFVRSGWKREEKRWRE